jgi:hypothetical protein
MILFIKIIFFSLIQLFKIFYIQWSCAVVPEHIGHFQRKHNPGRHHPATLPPVPSAKVAFPPKCPRPAQHCSHNAPLGQCNNGRARGHPN